MISSIFNGWDSFFHDRTGIQGCRIAGWMRMAFALFYLIDRIMMAINLDFFFSPDTGVLPYRLSGRNDELVGYHQWSLFMFFPDSMEFVWLVSVIGVVQGVIVLLGATRYPRLHMFGLYLNIMSFLNHNTLMWDGEDNMFRMWVFFFLFFPLDHCTIYDGFGFGSSSSSSSSSSWPMWIFRIFQIEIVIIYMGASIGKLVVPYWQDGSAIYRLTYGIEDYPGIFNPDFMFGRYGPLKILCWSALLLEGICYITVWIPALRNVSVALMVFLHIGIDFSMNMHMFEWLSCVGWIVFLVQPAPKVDDGSKAALSQSSIDKKHKNKMISIRSFLKKALTNIFVSSVIFIIMIDSVPYTDITHLLPKSMKPAWKSFVERKTSLFIKIDSYISPIGVSQGGDWGMYSNVHVVLTDTRIDAVLVNGTLIDNIWRSPDWFKMSDWKRKFYARHMNFYSEVVESKDELLYFVELMSKPVLENHDVKGLKVVEESRTHKEHEMKSTSGFWDPVVKHPMDITSEEELLQVRVGDDGKFVVEYWREPDANDDDDDDNYYDEDDEDDDNYEDWDEEVGDDDDDDSLESPPDEL